jgi:hypothetical protein
MMKLALVDKDYMLDLGDLHGKEDVKQRMIFLLNSVKVLFCPVKDYMIKYMTNKGLTFEYTMGIDTNTTLYLDKNSKKRIGILLTEVSEFPTATR